jgi:hypothetical protein
MRVILALLVTTCLASAQDGGPMFSRHGVGHDTWHAQFYSKLVKDDGGSQTVLKTGGDSEEAIFGLCCAAEPQPAGTLQPR